jgi:hypothetical protein
MSTGTGGSENEIANGTSFGSDKNVQKFDSDDGCTTLQPKSRTLKG